MLNTSDGQNFIFDFQIKLKIGTEVIHSLTVLVIFDPSYNTSCMEERKIYVAYFLAPHTQKVNLPKSLSIASSRIDFPIPFISYIYCLAQVYIARVASFKQNDLC